MTRNKTLTLVDEIGKLETEADDLVNEIKSGNGEITDEQREQYRELQVRANAIREHVDRTGDEELTVNRMTFGGQMKIADELSSASRTRNEIPEGALTVAVIAGSLQNKSEDEVAEWDPAFVDWVEERIEEVNSFTSGVKELDEVVGVEGNESEIKQKN